MIFDKGRKFSVDERCPRYGRNFVYSNFRLQSTTTDCLTRWFSNNKNKNNVNKVRIRINMRNYRVANKWRYQHYFHTTHSPVSTVAHGDLRIYMIRLALEDSVIFMRVVVHWSLIHDDRSTTFIQLIPLYPSSPTKIFGFTWFSLYLRTVIFMRVVV